MNWPCLSSKQPKSPSNLGPHRGERLVGDWRSVSQGFMPRCGPSGAISAGMCGLTEVCETASSFLPTQGLYRHPEKRLH